MKKLKYLLVLVSTVSIISCKTEKLITPPEPVKDITGSWKITQATRNGTDITSRFDFSTFRITFSDSSYALTNLVPFLVYKSGTWHFDNPSYPFNIYFTAKDSATKTTPIAYPVVAGKRNIIFNISPGCTSNTYQYTLQKVD